MKQILIYITIFMIYPINTVQQYNEGQFLSSQYKVPELVNNLELNFKQRKFL